MTNSPRFTRARVVVWFSLLMALLGCRFLAARTFADQPAPAAPLVSVLHIDGDVEPILATYLEEGLNDAAQRHAALVVITMDTPGGLSDSFAWPAFSTS